MFKIIAIIVYGIIWYFAIDFDDTIIYNIFYSIGLIPFSLMFSCGIDSYIRGKAK